MVRCKIREGRIDDIVEIHRLATELQAQSFYAGIPADDTKFKRTLAALMGSRYGCVLVIADENDRPVGFLEGMSDELFFSRKRYATDLCTYVIPEARAYYGWMVRRFLKWAKDVPNLVEITLGISSGMGDVERIGKIYERLGLTRVGGLYMMRVSKCQVS